MKIPPVPADHPSPGMSREPASRVSGDIAEYEETWEARERRKKSDARGFVRSRLGGGLENTPGETPDLRDRCAWILLGFDSETKSSNSNFNIGSTFTP